MADVARTELPPLTPELIKVRFKQLQLQTNNVYQNWQIRVHRPLSWFKRATEMPVDQPEAKFLLLWISFNCLYSRWDPGRNAPAQDAAARQDFLARVCRMNPSLVEATLRRYAR